MKNRAYRLRIDNVPNGVYKVTFQIINQENGNGEQVLRRYTVLTSIDSRMANFIANQYIPIIYQKEIVVRDETLTDNLVLTPLEIIFVNYELISVD